MPDEPGERLAQLLGRARQGSVLCTATREQQRPEPQQATAAAPPASDAAQAPAKEEASAAGNAAGAGEAAAAVSAPSGGDDAQKPADDGRFSDSDEEEEACIDKDTGKVKRSNSVTDMYSGENYQEMLKKMMGPQGGLGMGGYDLEAAERKMQTDDPAKPEPFSKWQKGQIKT